MAIDLPAVLNLKPEELDTPDKRSKYTVSVIGCGLRGIFYTILFAEAGFKVICADADQSSIKKIAKGSVPLAGREIENKLKPLIKKEQITTTSEIKTAVAQSNIVIITIRPKAERKGTNYAQSTSCCKQIGTALQKGSLVVYSEVAGLDFLEGTIKETLEDTSGLKVGEDFGLVYSPLQSLTLQGTSSKAYDGIIAALDKTSLNSATIIFSTLEKKSYKTTLNMKAAELAILFQAAKHNVNLALVNELAIFCENVGLDYHETMKLLPESCETNLSIPTIIQEDNPSIMHLLEDSAENSDIKLRLPPLARQINEDMVKHAVNLTQDALRKCEKTLRRAKIAIIGTASPGTSNLKFIELLEAKGAKISQYNPQGSDNSPTVTGLIVKKTINETVEGTDCIVMLSEQDQLKRLNLKKLKTIMKSPAAMIDLSGTIEPDRAQEEGFTYRGLGRGTWKK